MSELTEVERLLAENEKMRDMLGELWLYVDWRYCTKQLPTEQKEIWAGALEDWSAQLNEGSSETGVVADRWWLCPTCGVSIRAREEDGLHARCAFDEARLKPTATD